MPDGADSDSTAVAFVLLDPGYDVRGVYLTWEVLVAAMPGFGWPATNPACVGVTKDGWEALRTYINPSVDMEVQGE